MKPQDVLVALKLCLHGAGRSYADLGYALGMSPSEVHASVRRLGEARLVDPETKEVKGSAFLLFLIHGVPHAFATSCKEVTRGMPTAWAAPVMEGKIGATDQLPPVWPDPEGRVQGTAVQPLYASVLRAAKTDLELYDLLALVDTLRIGRARERGFAEKELSKRLTAHVAT